VDGFLQVRSAVSESFELVNDVDVLSEYVERRRERRRLERPLKVSGCELKQLGELSSDGFHVR
jgi:hypothetical protein